MRTAVIGGVLFAVGIAVLVPVTRAFAGSWSTANGERLAEMTELSERSLVVRRDGSTLAVLHADENRAPVKLDKVPEIVVDAVIGIEDDRYWDHHGIDLRATVRALATNVGAGEVRQGGSTITQQLIKNSLLTPEKTVDRKVREAFLAWRLEDHSSKEEILERYLNTVYFGNGAYGVQAAAEVYFGKQATELGAAEAVLLAGLIRNPAGYDPIRFPERALSRRRVVVERLRVQSILSNESAERVLETPLPTKVESLETETNDYFVEQVKQELLDDERLGETAQERYNAVFKGGLRIVTTLDPTISSAALLAVDTILPDTDGKFTAALASVEPSTGAVRAIVGGSDFESTKFNLATQAHRQAGSAFKTMVLVAALREGYGPSTIVNGTSPCSVEFPGHAPYEPGNYEGSAGGVMTITSATAASVNCAYVRMAQAAGLDKVVEASKDLGITSEIDEYPSTALGGLRIGVSPLEMASAYATLAADGVYHKPYFIERVLDRHGKVVLRGGGKGEQKVSVQVARAAVSILKSVVTGGTGTRANIGKWQVFGKTGTAQDYTDAWFVGSTRQLTAAVWMGSPVGKVPMKGVPGAGNVTGGSFPARIWGAFMKAAMKGRQALPFPAPDPKQLGNKVMKGAPSRFTGPSGVTDTTIFIDDGIVIDIPGDDGTPTTSGGNRPTPTTRPPSPPPTSNNGCTEPPDWPDDYPPFCG
ncbi:MAG: PBP1A family penicillin-binding protein [Acidimicrobiales bacterium]|nr:PBP1A family penicillin-binding protein [Acidimicrobiales bacterium]